MRDLRHTEVERLQTNPVPKRPEEDLIRAEARRVAGRCHVCGVAKGGRCARRERWDPPCPAESARYIGGRPLSPQDWRVLALMADGVRRNTAEIANELGIPWARTSGIVGKLRMQDMLFKRRKERLRITSVGVAALEHQGDDDGDS